MAEIAGYLGQVDAVLEPVCACGVPDLVGVHGGWQFRTCLVRLLRICFQPFVHGVGVDVVLCSVHSGGEQIAAFRWTASVSVVYVRLQQGCGFRREQKRTQLDGVEHPSI